jgi:hypothetical protein
LDPTTVFGPSPEGDVIEEVAQSEHRAVHDRRRHLLISGGAVPPSACVVPHQGLFNAVPVELEAVYLRVVLAEEQPERGRGR